MIVVTGASGKLGQHVIEALVKRVPAGEVVAAVRSVAKAAELAKLGVQVKEADYSKPDTLAKAFAGAEKVLLISSNDLENRIPQQKAVVDAAKAAGVKLIAYTSILRADTSKLGLAKDHKETEEYIKASGLPYVLLRNGWYFENRTEALAPALEHGAILGAAGDGRFAAASRVDYAGAAAVALTTPGRENTIYELGGDAPYTLEELAAEVSKQSGKTVVYKNLPEQAFAEALEGFGLPKAAAELIADSETGASKGELDRVGNDLSTLLGRPTTTLSAAVAAGLKA